MSVSQNSLSSGRNFSGELSNSPTNSSTKWTQENLVPSTTVSAFSLLIAPTYTQRASRNRKTNGNKRKAELISSLCHARHASHDSERARHPTHQARPREADSMRHDAPERRGSYDTGRAREDSNPSRAHT